MRHRPSSLTYSGLIYLCAVFSAAIVVGLMTIAPVQIGLRASSDLRLMEALALCGFALCVGRAAVIHAKTRSMGEQIKALCEGLALVLLLLCAGPLCREIESAAQAQLESLQTYCKPVTDALHEAQARLADISAAGA